MRQGENSAPSMHGMAMPHARQLSEIMQHDQTNFIVIFRPINPEAGLLYQTENVYGKGLQTKGKSCIFPPINGLVTKDIYIARVLTEAAASALQDKTNKEIANSELMVKAISDLLPLVNSQDEVSRPLSNIEKEALATIGVSENLQESSESSNFTRIIIDAKNVILCTEITKVVNHEIELEEGGEVEKRKYNLLYFPAHRMQQIANSQEICPEPFFAIRKDSELLFFDPSDNKFKADQDKARIVVDFAEQNVELLAYDRFIENEASKTISMEDCPRKLTADYDPLIICYPQQAPDEDIRLSEFVPKKNSLAPCSKSLIDKAAGKQLEIIYNENKRQDYQNGQGSNTGDELAILATFLSNDMNLAIKHGPETNNPYPELLGEGDYIVFDNTTSMSATDSSGKIKISTNIIKKPKEIIEYINKKRAEGYPLKVNPKWPIESKDGKLEFIENASRLTGWSEIDRVIGLISSEDAKKTERGLVDKYLALRELELASPVIFANVENSKNSKFWKMVGKKCNELHRQNVATSRQSLFEAIEDFKSKNGGSEPVIARTGLNPHFAEMLSTKEPNPVCSPSNLMFRLPRPSCLRGR